MGLTLVLSVMLMFSAYSANHARSQIYELDQGENAEEETLVFLTNGQVLRLGSERKKSILDLIYFKKSFQWIEFTFNEKHEIESYVSIPSPIMPKNPNSFSLQKLTPYLPTVIEGMELATTYFKQAKYVDKESQCYNRAHIWSYEWFNNHSINSNKTWLFFTRRYIRKFKFNWWFHVSPSIRVMEDGIEKEKIMDIKYARGPLSLKRWTDIFMQDNASCPVVKTYTEYANYPESGSCFTMRTSMYHYQPLDLESEETWGTTKTGWYETEIKQAYLEAFDEII
jgi:hypothetical protein